MSPAPRTRIAVFSDLHLPNKPDARNQAFAELVDQFTREEFTDIWLLGDILDLMAGPFEFWLAIHRGIFDALSRFIARGGRVLWLEGNHDFHLDELLQPLGIELRDEQLRLEVGVKKLPVYLAHGDLVNTSDEPYLRWRAQTRNRWWRTLLSLTPEFAARRWLLPFGEKLSRRSRGKDRDEPAKILALYRAFAEEKIHEGVRGVFLGHCHVEDFYRPGGGEAFYLNLGSWLDGRLQYAIWEPDAEAFPKVQTCKIMEG